MATYDKDDRIRVTATFTSGGSGTEAGNKDADPATLTATQRKPSGSSDDVALTIDDTDKATGVYFVDVDLDQIGTHTVKWKSTENVIAAEVVELKVGKSVFDHS